MIVAELSIIPLAGSTMRPYVDAALDVIKRSGLKYEVGAMGTAIEGDLDAVLAVVKKAHEAVKSKGPERVITELRINDGPKGSCSISKELAGYR